MTTPRPSDAYVTRGGEKLAAALDHFGIKVSGEVCTDLGSHVGGFVDCLLRRGAIRVYSVDTAYGTLAWKLRRDPRVIVFERTNAMHVRLPELVDLVTIDVGWTPQSKILPNTAYMLRPGGKVVTLIKPQYEAPQDWLDGGLLPDDKVDRVLAGVLKQVTSMGWSVVDTVASPLCGQAGNRELLAWLTQD